jgi:crotonobetainyl-CoA:carnitine CoA-transferase CaiB-like acyl-CoA transferase
MEGVKVVELGVWVAGPAAGGILADWGADVIKIEPPTGDPARMFGRMLGIEDGVSPPFEMDNRSKRSIVLDLTTLDDQATALELLRDADVFITNVRPGALRRIGLDFESVTARNTGLVYGLITGYGERGPEADRAAYDVAAFWAEPGWRICSPGPGPHPAQRGGAGDHTAGMTLAAAVCAALRLALGPAGPVGVHALYRRVPHRELRPQYPFLTGHSIAIGQRSRWATPYEQLRGGGRARFLLAYRPVAIAAACRAVGRPGWLTDPRYDTAQARELTEPSPTQTRSCDKAARRRAKIFASERSLLVPDQFHRRCGRRQFHAAGCGLRRTMSSAPMVATPATLTARRGTARGARLGAH